MKVRGISVEKRLIDNLSFFIGIHFWSRALWQSCHLFSSCRSFSFSLGTFRKVIVLPKCSFFFCFSGLQETWEQSQKYHYIEGDIRGARPSDGELWRSSLISELPCRDKGPLKSQETEQSKSQRTFQEKQRATETQHDPGHSCVWTSDESFSSSKCRELLVKNDSDNKEKWLKLLKRIHKVLSPISFVHICLLRDGEMWKKDMKLNLI